jgi:hypothetical protein
MNALDRAWAAWETLGEADREAFVGKLRESYAEPRRRREKGGAPRRPMSFDEIVLTEADFGSSGLRISSLW